MKQRKRLASLLIVFSILACGTGLKVTTYISDPDQGGMQGSDHKGNKSFKPYSETEGFVCFNKQDTQTLLNYCKSKDQ